MEPKFHIAVNRQFVINKTSKLGRGDPRWGKYNDTFENVTLTQVELRREIQAGHGITSPHRHERHTKPNGEPSAYRHNLNWILSQHLGLDHDDLGFEAVLDLHDGFICEYGSFLYTTASHTPDAPRTRSIFLLEQPITDKDEYAEAAAALHWKFAGTVDSSCKEVARNFFGSEGCEIRNIGQVLPVAVLEELCSEFRAAMEAERASRKPAGTFQASTPDLVKVQDALEYIPRQMEYHEWLDVLMAIHSEYPNSDGIAVCEAWSPGYPGEIERKFASFSTNGNHAGKIGIGTLFRMAQQYGWQPPAVTLPEDFTFGNADAEPVAGTNGHDKPTAPLIYKAEDGGILDVWLVTYGKNWLFVNGYDKWYRWDGTHWMKDETQNVKADIQDLMERLNNRAHQDLRAAGDNKEAIAIAKAYVAATKRSKMRVASVEAMAQARRGIRTADLNAGNLLNMTNGVLDLDTFELLPHDPSRPMTYVLPFAYDPEAKAPLWREAYLPTVLVDEETLQPDDTLILLIQELVGYTLTTATNYEVMAWLSGEGGNGKTVFVTVTQHLLGDLACTVDFQTLGLPGNYDVADLPGKRFVFSTESKRGGQFVEGLLRKLVSGERVRTRAIYGSPFEYDSVAKFWWAMNDKPVITDTSNATWRRMKLIPFNRTFEENEKDVDLTAKLLGELPGILNWAIEGLKRLRANGKFTHSEAANVALSDYRKVSNPVAQWLAEETIPAPDGLFLTKASAAYSKYKLWAERNGQRAENSTMFGRELKRLGIERDKNRDGVFYNFGMVDDSENEKV